MLLRSASTPVLKCEVADLGPKISPPFAFMRLQRTSSEDNLLRKRLPLSGYRNVSSKCTLTPLLAEEHEETNVCMETALSLVGSNGSQVVVAAVREKTVTAEGGGAGSRDGGGKAGSSGGVGVGGGDSGNGTDGSESMEVYYQKMIRRYPENALILSNYAKFLKEVRGDAVKAEEFLERAILANGCDENVLCMYGDLIWNNHRDAERAQSYFDKAVQSCPDNCYVLASYAWFLWDSSEEDEQVLEYELNSLQSCAADEQSYTRMSSSSCGVLSQS